MTGQPPAITHDTSKPATPQLLTAILTRASTVATTARIRHPLAYALGSGANRSAGAPARWMVQNSDMDEIIRSPVPAPGHDVAAPPISQAIYGMPMFATLQVADIDRTISWYTQGLGFIQLFTMPGTGGPVLVHLRRWQFQDLLVRPAGEPSRPGTGCTLSFAAVYGEVDKMAEMARDHGAGQVEGPADTPWNTRDLTTVDLDGNVVIFTAARPPEEPDSRLNEQMHRWSDEQGITNH